MSKIIKLTESQLKYLIDKQINEQENPKEDGSYMVLSNLVMIKDYIETILKFKHQTDFSKLVTGEHAWAADHIATAKDDIQEVANFVEAYFEKDNLSEEKMKGKNPCWKGYEMVGKKMKNGKEVPNCVPINEIEVDDGLSGKYNGHKWEVLHDGKKSWIVVDGSKIMTAKGEKSKNIAAVEKYIDSLKDEKIKESVIYEDEHGSVEDTDFISNDLLNEAEYQGRKVQLGKIMQGDVKKFKVYVKNDKGKVVKVNFGFGGSSAKGKVMKIKKNNPERRKSFRARHHCDNPGPRWKPRYWACKTW